MPNGNIASGGQDSKIKIWDVNKKICLYTLEGHSSIIWDIKYLQKNKLISASDDNSCKLWNLDSKKNEINNQKPYKVKKTKQEINDKIIKNNEVILNKIKKNKNVAKIVEKEKEKIKKKKKKIKKMGKLQLV